MILEKLQQTVVAIGNVENATKLFAIATPVIGKNFLEN